MNKWIKKYLSSFHSYPLIKKSVTLKKLKPFLKFSFHSQYDCQSVARGVAAGLAGAVIPGFQFLYAAILAILFRGNLTIALALTFITNPFTVIPIVYLIYLVGTLMTGNGNPNFVPSHFKWEFFDFHDFSFNMSTWILQFGKSFLVGVLVLSVGLAIAGYFGTILIWKISIFVFQKKNH